MSVKIQINCLKALEALLAADPEVEIEFRKSVLLEYERKHILPQIETRVKELVDSCVQRGIGSIDYYGKCKLKPDIESLLVSKAKEEADRTVRNIAKETAIDICDQTYVENVIKNAVTDEIISKLRKKIISEISGTT